jgi:hypothetical protein
MEFDFAPQELDKPPENSEEDKEVFNPDADNVTGDNVEKGELGIEGDEDE